MAALSLRCAECGAALKSVAEAQDHGEATGHSRFEESEEAVTQMVSRERGVWQTLWDWRVGVGGGGANEIRTPDRIALSPHPPTQPLLFQVCTDCGKPCRTDTERDLHTKRTGHASFVDKTGEEAAPMDTEAQMKAAAADAEAAARAEFGLGAAKDKAPDEGTAGEKDEGPLVEPPVDADALAALESMGFARNRAVRGLHFGDGGVEGAVAWLDAHGGDEGVDEPLLIPESKIKKPLTAAEKEAAAAELVARARAKREAEERALAKEREANRVRAGKELLKAQREAKDAELRRNAELRRIEKEEEARARERVRAKLEEDRRERRRRLGLPEDKTPAERAAREAAEAEKAAAKAAAEAARRLPVKRVSTLAKQRDVLVGMKKAAAAGGDEQFRTACTTMLKLLANAATGEAKYRRLRLANAKLAALVFSVGGAVDFLKLAGFSEAGAGDDAALELPPVDSPDAPTAADLAESGALLDSALTNPMFGAL